MTDTCPNCLTRGIPPATERRRGRHVAHGYICRCGHRWATARLLAAYGRETPVHPARHQEAGNAA